MAGLYVITVAIHMILDNSTIFDALCSWNSVVSIVKMKKKKNFAPEHPLSLSFGVLSSVWDIWILSSGTDSFMINKSSQWEVWSTPGQFIVRIWYKAWNYISTPTRRLEPQSSGLRYPRRHLFGTIVKFETCVYSNLTGETLKNAMSLHKYIKLLLRYS